MISGGPSRQYITEADLLDGAIVTVNRAIDVADRGIVVDFATFADPPSAIFEVLNLEKYLQPPIQVWVPRPCMYVHNDRPAYHDMVSLWEPFLPASVGLRTTPFGTVIGEDGSSRYMFCLLAALFRIAMFRPTRIRILSADMMGSWILGKSEAECEAAQSDIAQARFELGRLQKAVNATRGQQQDLIRERDEVRQALNELEKLAPDQGFSRWKHERWQLKQFQKRMEELGCAIEWISPKGAALT